MVCNNVEIEPQLQDVTGEQLSNRSNLAMEARLDIHARGFWEQHLPFAQERKEVLLLETCFRH